MTIPALFIILVLVLGNQGTEGILKTKLAIKSRWSRGDCRLQVTEPHRSRRISSNKHNCIWPTLLLSFFSIGDSMPEPLDGMVCSHSLEVLSKIKICVSPQPGCGDQLGAMALSNVINQRGKLFRLL